MGAWPVNRARSHWSEVLDQADAEGPQIITHHGKERAVVLSIDQYRSLEIQKLQSEIKQHEEGKPDFITFLLSGPKIDFEDFELERDRSTDREVDL